MRGVGVYDFSTVTDEIHWGINQNRSLYCPNVAANLYFRKNTLTGIIKFQQLNSEFSYLKHFQEVSQSDLQAVKIRLEHFLEMFHV